MSRQTILWIVLGIIIVGVGIYWFFIPKSTVSNTQTGTTTLEAISPTDCHGDSKGIAYWRTDMVNLAYFEKGGKVYYCDIQQGGNPIRVSDDPSTFKLISGGLPKDNSLHELVPVYAKDSEKVYAGYIVLNKADPKTFNLLDSVGIGTDSTHVYFGSHMLDSAEWYPQSFRINWPNYYYSIDDSRSPTVLRVFAEINGNHVSLNMYSGEIKSMPGIDFDLASFTVLYGSVGPDLYAKDSRNVYCWNHTDVPVVMERATPSSFRTATRADVDTAAQRGLQIDAYDSGNYFYKCQFAGVKG